MYASHTYSLNIGKNKMPKGAVVKGDAFLEQSQRSAEKFKSRSVMSGAKTQPHQSRVKEIIWLRWRRGEGVSSFSLKQLSSLFHAFSELVSLLDAFPLVGHQ
jgi:hypothetical protein